MDSNERNSKIKFFLICFLVAVLVVGVLLYKPTLKNATIEELDDIHGIEITVTNGKVDYGVIGKEIVDYINAYPDCKVEDLRILKGVDDMIIDQLKERFR